MSVPLLDLREQNSLFEEGALEALQKMIRSGRFILGPEVERFEDAIADKLNVAHAIGVSSGTDALLIALMALDIKAGDEVLIPAFTFFATAGSVARVGAKPVFVDSCPYSFNIDIDHARELVNENTRAIIPVHLFGQMADMDSVMAFAEEFDLFVIEDAAQSIGAKFQDYYSGTMGDVGAFSFFPTKNLGAFGDAGMVVTQDEILADKIVNLRNHGMNPRYYHSMIGGNFRLDAFQAAMLNLKLPHLDAYAEKRRINAMNYDHAFGAMSGVVHADTLVDPMDEKALESIHLVLPSTLSFRTHVWNQYTIRVLHGQRDALREHLQCDGIGSEIYYPLTLDEQQCFKDIKPNNISKAPHRAHQLSKEVLSLPIFPELREIQRQEVIHSVGRFLERL